MNIEDIRKRSIELYAEARRKALHEAYFNTPIRSAAGASSSSGGGGGGVVDNTINEYVENGYVEDYFE
jgi:hypothetical protein